MTGLDVGDRFPYFTLPDHRGCPRTLSGYIMPSAMDEKSGSLDWSGA